MARQDREAYQNPAWVTAVVNDVAMGLRTEVPPGNLQEGESPRAVNVAMRNGAAVIDTGYRIYGDDNGEVFPLPTPFLGTLGLVGLAKGGMELKLGGGVPDFVLVTDFSVYKFANGFWQFVPDATGGTPVQTTLENNESTGATVLEVADTTGFSVNDYIGVILDSGEQWTDKIVSFPVVGAPGSIEIDNSLPSDAASGNSVIKAVELNGSDDEHVVWVPYEPLQWAAFTNGVDKPMYYDGTGVKLIPNLPSGGNFICKAMGIIQGHMVLGNVIEGGTSKPYRQVWCDTNDPTNWSTGNAGAVSLFDERDVILNYTLMGEDLIIYRERSIVRMRYLGGFQGQIMDHTVMVSGRNLSSTGRGCVSPNGVFNFGDFHIFLGGDGVYRYDGGFSARPISQKIAAGFFDVSGRIDRDKIARAFVLFTDERDDLFCFLPGPEREFPDFALVLNLTTGTWWLREFAHEITFADYRQENETLLIQDLVGTIAEQDWKYNSFNREGPPKLIFGSGTSERVFLYDYDSPDDAGTAIPYSWESKDFEGFDRDNRYTWFQGEVRGTGVMFSVSRDGGNNFEDLATISPGSAYEECRFGYDTVAGRVRHKYSGAGGGFGLRRLAHKYQEHSPNIHPSS